MTTLFTRESPRRVYPVPSGAAIVLYALTSVIGLGLTVEDFRGGHHSDRAWTHAITAALFLFLTALHLSRWLKERRVS